LEALYKRTNMPKTKISEFSATPANNTDIDSINLAEGCAPSGINDALRELMAQLKDFQTGAVGDSFNGPVNGTLGATTPATASVTTLAASGAVTLSGGTANGVTYLNGSKVLTSGSALQFDGSSLFLGATSAAAGKLVVKDTASSNTLWLVGRTSDGASSVSFRNAADSAYNARLEAVSGQLAFEANGSEQMRLTSTGLGIGTTSPNAKVQITATNQALGAADTSYGNLLLFTSNAMAVNQGGSISLGGIYYTDNAIPIAFGKVHGKKENASDANRAGYLAFETSNNATATTIERARFNSTGALVFAGGTTTADGIGITFPATQSASTNANTLDDYEEGTWTPVITDGTNNATMATGNGATYTKIGRSVTVNGCCFTSSLGSVTGVVKISGLPFTVASTNNFLGAGAVYVDQLNITAGQSVMVVPAASTTNMSLTINNSTAGATNMTPTQWSSDGFGLFSCTYFV
jgi:hypothetical protein